MKKTQNMERNLTMVMDFYELTMSNGYFLDKDKDVRVAFDVFYRKNPDNGGFAIFTGLEQVVEYVQNLHFEEEDIAYLRSQNLFAEEFLEYLADFKFTGDIYAFPEGTIMYPNEPCLTVVAPLIDAQLVETAILLQINHQSLIATKTRRIVHAAGDRGVSDFGADGHIIWMLPFMVRELLISEAPAAQQLYWPGRCLESQSAELWHTALSCSTGMSLKHLRNMRRPIRMPRYS